MEELRDFEEIERALHLLKKYLAGAGSLCGLEVD